MVGAPHGSLYEPKTFGSQGGSGGGAHTDINCAPKESHQPGEGGGVIQLFAMTSVEVDGQLLCDGTDAEGSRGGGGAGGSIHIDTSEFRGQGSLFTRGGNVPAGGTNCPGGGGAGGRIAIHYESNAFRGVVMAGGGKSEIECGGAGTILWHDKAARKDKLQVNNHGLCSPLITNIEYSKLDDLHRGLDSFRTWIFDKSLSDHNHTFAEVELSGGAHLALYRRNIDLFPQIISVAKTLGDKSGTFHIGPHQVSNCETVKQ